MRASQSETTSLTAALSARELTKIYTRGREQVRALDGVTFEIRQGEFVAIVGPSGAGKTTLLNLIGCMDSPSSGSLKIAGKEIQDFTERERTLFRREEIGFVFQHFGLIPSLTVEQNVALPLLFSRRSGGKVVGELLERVQLASRRDHRPHELSGGEMQRVAIARALVNAPSVLLADEPTGNLDQATGESIVRLFRELHADGLTIVVVTHNAELASAAERRLTLADGRIKEG